MPVGAPDLSSQATMSSTLLRNSAAVPTMAKSRLHAVITAFRASVLLRWESMKSTTTLRPARHVFFGLQLLLMYFAKPLTAFGTPTNNPGTAALSTSAMTAIRISLLVTPTSVVSAEGESVDCAAAPRALPTTATPTVRINPALRMPLARGDPNVSLPPVDHPA